MNSGGKTLSDRNMTEREAAELLLKGELDPETYIRIRNKEVDNKSRRHLETEPPGPHEHI